MLKLALPALCLTLAACAADAGSPGTTGAGQSTVAGDARQRALQGRALGEPVSCVTTREIETIKGVSDRVLFFHLKNGRTYRNDLPAACPAATRSGTSFSYRTTGAQLCAIDVVQLAEPASGFAYGGCQLGKFVRYELPEGVTRNSF
jgi:hypothetical protein